MEYRLIKYTSNGLNEVFNNQKQYKSKQRRSEVIKSKWVSSSGYKKIQSEKTW